MLVLRLERAATTKDAAKGTTKDASTGSGARNPGCERRAFGLIGGAANGLGTFSNVFGIGSVAHRPLGQATKNARPITLSIGT